MVDVPVGTLTVLITDSIGVDDDLITSAVEAHHGVWPRVGGTDGRHRGRMAAFTSAASAIAAAIDAQRAFARGTAGDEPAPAVRIGIDTGDVFQSEGSGYTGVALRRAAMLRDVAHRGQALLSSTTASIVTGLLPTGAWVDDLGTHHLRDLSRPERIFELRHTGLSGHFPPLPTQGYLATGLPTHLPRFVGRFRELAEVRALLAQNRLVTLTGSGGCGKTRLAGQAVAGLAHSWPDGVWWVGLGSVFDPSQVGEMVAAKLRIPTEAAGAPTRALISQLGDRRLLLCLDNCEHLVDPCAELVARLLESCPGVSVLVTSREPLGVPGETAWRVPSMSTDDAVTLFADRAGRVSPGFTVDEEKAEAVGTICRRLDGIPLAVELAAAWVPALPLAEIATRLDDRFGLLSRGVPGAVPSHRTLEASMQWSYHLLDDADRAVFRRLGVFTGGFSIEAAQSVCTTQDGERTDVVAALRRLVEKSLVVADHQDDDLRYRLLETVRHYADDRLEGAGEAAATRDRHVGHYLALAEKAETELERADQDSWRDRLWVEHDNLRAAIDWALSSGDTERGRRLVAALPRFWLLGGHGHEGITHLRRSVALGGGDRTTLQTRLLVGTALLGATGGRLELTLESAQRGLELARANDDVRNQGRCLGLLAYVHLYDDCGAGRDLALQARRCAASVDDRHGVSLSLVIEGLALVNGDRHHVAGPVLEAAARSSRSHNDRMLIAFALTGQMESALRTGDVPLADRLGTEALLLAEPLGSYFTVGITTSNLAWVKGIAGDLSGGKRLLDEVIRSVAGAGEDVDVPTLAATAGYLHLWSGDLPAARVWLERAVSGGPFGDTFLTARALPGLAAAFRHLGEPERALEQVERAIAVARKIAIPRVLADALDELGHLVAAEDPARADELHHEALALRIDHGLRTFYVDSLDALARHASRRDDTVYAARLYAASTAARREMGYPCPPVSCDDRAADISRLRTRLGDHAFDIAWSQGSSLSLEEAAAFVRRTRGERSRPTSGWASLTPTELDVVDRTVEGLTNDEIGARLLMSRNTVKTHLRHIYAKLGIANRTELAVLAMARLPR